ncbi:MAG: hypothetical protein EA355_15860 [Rhodobacteraceae bacterium]|nr:MAG: hypothetical protein EA355_15860 [Paracoccaceae bacterium]
MRWTPLAFAAALAISSMAQTVSAGPVLPITKASDHPLAGQVIKTATGRALDPAGLLAALAGADVVVLGEVHDNAEHHMAQAWLVSELAPAALAFEMIPRGMEGVLERLRAEGAPLAVIGAALEWESRGWPDWGLYAPILAAAPDAPITGGELGREASALAMREGAEAAARRGIGAAARLYRLDRPFDSETQAAAVAQQVAAHCDAIPEHVGERMVEAQRLRDAAFADAVLRARALGEDGLVALIAGSGHARIDRGAPLFLNKARPDLSVVSLAMVEAREGAYDWRGYAQGPGDAAPVFDFVWFTAPAVREDPCEAFLRSRR